MSKIVVTKFLSLDGVTEAKYFSSGVVLLRYQPDGKNPR